MQLELRGFVAPLCLKYLPLRSSSALSAGRFGSIGHRVARLAQAYQMRVVALRRNLDKAQADLDSGLLVG